jgi:hypothetical protein
MGVHVRAKAYGIAGILLVCAVCFGPTQARAGTGLPYYGAEFGFFDFFESGGQFANTDGGFTFGPKAGVYMISDWIAVGLDAAIIAGIAGDDMDQWFVNFPAISAEFGTGIKAFMLFIGGGIQLFGLDGLDDTVAFSLGNPYACAGLQLGWAGFFVRGEYQIGHTFRFGDHQDYSFTNIAITVGYGPYYDML